MSKYLYENHRTYKLNDDGEHLMLANFVAKITKETRIMDGINTETILTIEGVTPGGKDGTKPIELPPVDVPAQQFGGMQWVLHSWGVRAVIQPGSGVKDDLRASIQLNSTPDVEIIYRSTGWQLINGELAYLHRGGAITKAGNNPTIRVKLPPELDRYDLTTKVNPATAFKASLALAGIAPPDVGWTLWAATYTPLFGPCDFATHLTGRSGTFKSELISLFQSHYGPEMDARHLPGSWSSTGNALEAQAYCAANAPFVIDDFVPVGTSWQVRAYQTTADKIIRAQGNQAGRARLTDTSNLQATYYPRGIILSTGEDTPEGHSVRARMMIIELSPGDVKPEKLTKAQEYRDKFSAAIADLAQAICTKNMNIEKRAIAIRNKCLEIGHTRTPPMIGRLIATAEEVIAYAKAKGYIKPEQADKYTIEATAAIMEAGKKQQSYLETADPVELFLAGMRQLFAGGLGHVRALNGGIPANPTILGWTEETSYGSLPTFKSHGPCIGWINWQEDELYIEANIGYTCVKKVVGAELSLTKQTLFKRIKDAGKLLRSDETRQRNTVRVTAENHPRQVVALSASETLEVQEKPNDDQTPETGQTGHNGYVKPGEEVPSNPWDNRF